MITINQIRTKIMELKSAYANTDNFKTVSNLDYSTLLYIHKIYGHLIKNKYSKNERKEMLKCIVRLKKLRCEI